jgi:L-alanine-DL-glutamate epimerase-like enolase superfamily enzyme
VDANAGYTAALALQLARACDRAGVRIECWEQPCAATDLEGMAEVAAALQAPVIADESVKTLQDLRALVARPYADGVNLKLAKTGSLGECVQIGREARRAGLLVMMGGMVETRLGMTAAAHVACAVGGADFVDLDTAWLLAEDPYRGGYVAEGPRYTLPEVPGLGVTRA